MQESVLRDRARLPDFFDVQSIEVLKLQRENHFAAWNKLTVQKYTENQSLGLSEKERQTARSKKNIKTRITGHKQKVFCRRSQRV